MMTSSIDVVTETPKGSTRKYVHDEATGAYRVKKELPLGMCFPFDFGFIPGTLGEDGDALDVLIIADQAGFPGCVTRCRIIGVLQAEQSKNNGPLVRNDRYLAVPVDAQLFENINSVKDLPAQMIRELQQFFVTYNKKEHKKVTMLPVLDATEAWKMIQQATLK